MKGLVVGEIYGEPQSVPFTGTKGRLVRSELRKARLPLVRLRLLEINFSEKYSALILKSKDAEPNWILSLGSAATEFLTGYPRVSEVRGQVLDCLYGDAFVIPTWAPGYVLRGRQNASYEFTEDIERFAAVLRYDL